MTPTVRRNSEFERIASLQKRDPERVTGLLACEYRADGSKCRLLPLQETALYEASITNGLLGFISVGEGKTLLSLLLPSAFGAEKPLLLVPGSLVAKTQREAEAYAVEGWLIPPIQIMSYTALTQAKHSSFLDSYAPDAIICDEAHKLKNLETAAAKRVLRYMTDNPDTAFAAMSGTLTVRSLRDYYHLAAFALKENSPLPLDRGVLETWADAVDEAPRPFIRPRPGPLLEFCNASERQRYDSGTPSERLAAIRSAVGRRVRDTPGVVANQSSSVNAGLEIRFLEHPVPAGSATEAALARLEECWELPDSTELEDAPAVWRARRQLALGFYYRWVEQPPGAWLVARSAFIKFVRKKTRGTAGLDTAKQVRDYFPEALEVIAWREIERTFRVEVECVVLDDFVERIAEDWGAREGGIVWTEHTRWAAGLGCSYYGAEGRNTQGGQIEDTPRGERIYASVQANGTGRNLQQHSANLITSCPQQGAALEQLIGRTHRQGQTANVVTVDILVTHQCHRDAWAQALADAEYVREKTGQAQRILVAKQGLSNK